MADYRAAIHRPPCRVHVGEMYKQFLPENEKPVLLPVITGHCFHAAVNTALEFKHGFNEAGPLKI